MTTATKMIKKETNESNKNYYKGQSMDSVLSVPRSLLPHNPTMVCHYFL